MEQGRCLAMAYQQLVDYVLFTAFVMERGAGAGSLHRDGDYLRKVTTEHTHKNVPDVDQHERGLSGS